MKKLYTILFLLTISICSSGKTRFCGEIAWGYAPQFFVSKSFTYIPNGVGYRISEYGNSFCLENNAFLKISSSVEMFDRLSTGFKTGIQGIDAAYILIPLELDLKYFLKSAYNGGLYISLEGGTALHDWNLHDKVLLGAVGVGYREKLYKSINLNFFIQIHGLTCHPLPVDKYEGVIPAERVVFSYKGCTGLVIGVGIGF